MEIRVGLDFFFVRHIYLLKLVNVLVALLLPHQTPFVCRYVRVCVYVWARVREGERGERKRGITEVGEERE